MEKGAKHGFRSFLKVAVFTEFKLLLYCLMIFKTP
jgi:hypothetical protein